MTVMHCFPHSGGFSQQFRVLGGALAPLTLRSVDYPRPSHTPGSTVTVESFAEEWSRGLVDEDLEGSFLYGHSLGGLVAFESALRTERRGPALGGVVIAGTVPASCSPLAPIDPDRCSELELREWSFDTIHGRAPTRAETEVFPAFAPRLRRDLGMYRRYVPSDKIEHTPVLLLLGDRDRICPPEVRHFWDSHVVDLSTKTVEGGHLFHLESPSAVREAILDWMRT